MQRSGSTSSANGSQAMVDQDFDWGSCLGKGTIPLVKSPVQFVARGQEH